MRWQSATDPDAPSDIKKLYNRAMLEAMRKGRAFGAVDAVAMLTKIQAPTLVMFGRDDRVTPMDGALAAMRLIPQCELHVLLRLRALGDDRAQGRVREHRARVPGA